jgi:hypothetical protein
MAKQRGQKEPKDFSIYQCLVAPMMATLWVIDRIIKYFDPVFLFIVGGAGETFPNQLSKIKGMAFLILNNFILKE